MVLLAISYLLEQGLCVKAGRKLALADRFSRNFLVGNNKRSAAQPMYTHRSREAELPFKQRENSRQLETPAEAQVALGRTVNKQKTTET